MIELSIVTGTLDRPDSLNRLIESIKKHTSVSFEIVVADASTHALNISDATIRVIREWPRLGCVKGYNNAFAEAKGKWVIWLNDDCEVTPDYDTAAICFMGQNPQIGLGCLYYSEEPLGFHVNQHLGVPYANFGIIDRQLGNRIGWFGNELEMYGCDNWITFKVLLAGFGVMDIPESRVIHHSVKDHVRIQNNGPQMKARHDASRILDRTFRPFYHAVKQTYQSHAPKVRFKTLSPNAIARA